MTNPIHPQNDPTPIIEKFDIWLAKRIRWIVTPIIFLGFLIGVSVQIPQLETLKTRVEILERNQINDKNSISTIEKTLVLLLNLESDEKQKQLLKDALREIEQNKYNNK